MSLLKLIVDDSKFYLSLSNIKKYQNSLLYKVLSGAATDSRVVRHDDGYYIDADKDSFLLIVSYLRGYPVDFNNVSADLKKKIQYDAEYFQLNIFNNNNNIKKIDNLVEKLEEIDIPERSEDSLSCGLEDMLKLDDTEKEEFDREEELFSKTKKQQEGGTSKTKIEELVNIIQGDLNTQTISTLSNDKYVNDAIKKYNKERYEYLDERQPKMKTKYINL
jgi:hypothetical protein